MACCLSSALILGCGKPPDSDLLGSIKLGSSATANLALHISKCDEQPSRLRFESAGIGANKMSGQDSLEVFLENNDTLPLVIYLDSKKADVKIAPKHSERIFTGTFENLLLAGRGEYEDLTIKSCKERQVNATLKFVRLSGSDPLTINVHTWRIHYGL